ncbi:MAG: GNAT family N-acetyltransferase [Acidimicrobiales bacterium]|nr:GNAT family N-acetyltransferase [Acidimicrobiales bacterium]
MSDDVDTVRRFNRTITERIGALQDDYLARGRPLGASRVLWEVRSGTQDVRALRSRLNLDSGYLSRLLRCLESEGLVTVERAEHDRRRRIVRPTARGLRECRLLDRKSDELAASILAPLSEAQRHLLTEAMSTVERLLTAGAVRIAVEDPASTDAQFCIAQYFAELDQRFDGGFDPEASISADVDELTPPFGLLLVARLHDQPVGCGALKLHGGAPAEIKRMWVGTDARGLGLGRRLLAELERHATDRAVTTVRLETNRTLTEAISLYRSSGYSEVPAFNAEPFAHHWFEKRIP